MSALRALAMREYLAYFRLGVGWWVLAIFLLFAGLVFAVGTIRPGEPATMRAFFAQCVVLLLPMAPAISMRLFSEEYRQGTIETLMTAPVSEVTLVLAKFAGGLLFLLTMLAPTSLYALVLVLASDPAPDPGPLLAGFLCIVLLGAFYLAAGALASSLTSSQTLAFLASLLGLIGIVVGTAQAADRLPGQAGRIVAALSPSAWVRDFAKGIVDLSHIVGFVAASVLMLALCVAVLDARRWWGGAGRARRMAASAAFLGLVALGVVLAGVVAANLDRAGIPTRFDVTSTGEHRLAPTTERLLERLDGSHSILVAGNLAGRDRLAVERLRDVLAEMSRRGLRARVMDTASATGSEEFRRALEDLARREQPASEARTGRAREAIDRARDLARRLDELSPAMLGVRDLIDEAAAGAAQTRAYFDDRAARLRLAARGLEQGADLASGDLGRAVAGLPDADASVTTLRRSLQGVDDGLAGIADDLARFAGAESMPAAARDRAGALAPVVRSMRDDAARLRAELEDTRPSEFLRVARILESTEAAVIVGPPTPDDASARSFGAISLDVLLSSGTGKGCEEVIGGALAAMSQGSPPIVVLVHAHWEPILRRASGVFDAAVERLSLRGIDVVEWPAALEPAPADLSALLRQDPRRPVVYVAHSTDGGARAPGGGPDGPERIARLGRALASILDAGDPLLVSMTPSLSATFTGSDPGVAMLAAVGVSADTARPVFREEVREGKRTVQTHVVARPAPGEHPISRAIGNLPTIFFGAIPIKGERLAVLGAIDDPRAWGESEWADYWRTPEGARAGVARLPRPDEGRDDLARPFAVVGTVERAHPGVVGRTQRVVVVGSNAWFSDPVVRAGVAVDGRAVPAYPGNIELFEASVLWLAGQDDLIARTPGTTSVAMIRPMDARQRRLLTLGLGLGLPALVLAMGLTLRLARP